MNRCLRLAAAITPIGCANSVATAQVNWQTRFKWHIVGSDAPPSNSALYVIVPGTCTIVMQARIMNMTGLSPGQANHGLYSLEAQIHADGLVPESGETLGVQPATARIAPFNWTGDLLSGYVTEQGSTIAGPIFRNGSYFFSPFRALLGAPTSAWWECGSAMPTGPEDWLNGGAQVGFADRCADAYADIYQFQLTVTEPEGPAIHISPWGLSQPILQWSTFSSTDCDAPVSFVGLTAPTPRSFFDQGISVVRCPLDITVSPGPQTVRLGETTTLRVEASSPWDVTYQWLKDGEVVVDNARISGATTATLRVLSTGPADAGNYSVRMGVWLASTTTAAAALSLTCQPDWDTDRDVDPADVSAFVRDWLVSVQAGTLVGDYDHNGATSPADISAFVADWGAALGNGC